jgi:hypothetical protein
MSAYFDLAAGVGIAGAIAAGLRRKRVVLREDAIEIHDLAGTRIFARNQVRGCTIMTAPPGAVVTLVRVFEYPYLLLLLRDGRPSVELGNCFEFTEEFWQWIRTLPSPETGKSDTAA